MTSQGGLGVLIKKEGLGSGFLMVNFYFYFFMSVN